MKKIYQIVRAGVDIFDRNNCFTSAAAISFYAFFSIIPLMLLITAALGFVLGSRPMLQDRVISMVRETLPYLSDMIIANLRGLTYKWKAMSWLGLLFFVSSADLVLGAMAEALLSIFGTRKAYGFVRRKVINLFVLLLAILASFLSILITAVSIIAKNAHLNVFGMDVLNFLLQSVIFKYAVPFLVVSFFIAIVYRMMAGPALDLRYAFYGSLIFTALWEAAKQVFAWYIYNFPSYNKFYGSLGTIMVLLLWIFYSANIFLFSASLARASFEGSGQGARRGKA